MDVLSQKESRNLAIITALKETTTDKSPLSAFPAMVVDFKGEKSSDYLLQRRASAGFTEVTDAYNLSRSV